MTDIIMQAYHVLDEIRRDSTYQSIQKLDQMIAKLYQDEIEQFQKAKVAYETIMSEGGTFHPDFKDAVKRFSETKAVLYAKPEVKAYFDSEKIFQDELNQFLFDMTQAVSSHIKTPDQMGIVKKGGSCHVR
jgi:cell fate (sporulation/competence/biofilm development) regulator YlbF (YheA/YmcA/DUF963 family)